MKIIFVILILSVFNISLYSQPFEQTLNNQIMDNFDEINDIFYNTDPNSEYVQDFIDLIMTINSFIMQVYYRGEYNHEIVIPIQQFLDYTEYDIIMNLFDNFNIENIIYQYVIASSIVQILIYENIFLGDFPELVEYLKSVNEDNLIGDEEFDINLAIYLDNINNLLSSFNNFDVELVRNYMYGIMENLILE